MVEGHVAKPGEEAAATPRYAGDSSNEQPSRKNTKRARRLRRKRRRKAKKKLKKKRRRENRRRKKKRRKEKRKRARERGDPSSDSSDSTESTETSSTQTSSSTSTEPSSDTGFTGDSSESEDEGYRPITRREKRSKKVTVVYGGTLDKDPKAPYLKQGDASSRAAFRVKYLKYLKNHDIGQPTRPPEYRTHPKAVVECMDTDLLWYACKYELPKEYRTSKPEGVDALVVHRWVMQKEDRELSADDEEGIRQIKALKCNLTGVNGVRQVQNLFIQLRKIRMKYRLKTSPKQIIFWVTENLSPARVKDTVTNLQKQGESRGRKACKNLDYYHKLLRKIARKFKTAYDLGQESKPASKSERSRGNANRRGGAGKGRNQRSKGGKGRNKEHQTDHDTDGDGASKGGRRSGSRNDKNNKSGARRPVPKHIKCINCNGNHYVSDCPRLSKEKQNWTFEQHLAAKRARSNGSGGARSNPEDGENSGRRNPGGGNNRNPKNRLP